MEIEILKKSDINDTMRLQITELYKQLNDSIKQCPLHQILQEDNHIIFAACRIEDQIVGIALLATYKVISGRRGMVEDVVVDTEHRGKGIGRKLMEKLLEEARHRNLDSVLLFSGHHREAAISLYKSLGFTLRDSGVYNLKLS
ncbi:phosphinothricin acetyltransferase [Pricia antarctica]|uniref:Phosphinothricin acetyltransferase n=1 Tax=Pricia antarctica TaxID=641691 RepID=A0A1G7BLK2_9FLAO|nr:GNAT family N-acetyltransferase [Pricia antarctica]SDE27155.1 phosphinothricin acetyltransferase [Pricia antarctica]